MTEKYELKLNKDSKIKVPNKTVLGLYEYVKIKGKKILARIDSGAVKSSIDVDLAAELKLGPIIGSRIIKNVHGANRRPLIELEANICNKKAKATFSLQSRKHMKFKILIGQNILTQGFIIDPNKNNLVKKEE
jgi:hypothetical protein